MSNGDDARKQTPSALAQSSHERATARPRPPSSAKPTRDPSVIYPASGDNSGSDSQAAGVADTALSLANAPAASPKPAGKRNQALASTLADADTIAGVVSDDASVSGLPSSATTTADTKHDPLIGQVLVDRYRITGKIGQGGMGAVYEAEHQLIGKRVAVKVLLDKYAQRDPVVARLEQEARLASSIGHEHIIDITDFGRTPDDRTFVVMEYLEGESLGACLSREGYLPELRAIHIARQVASALSAAHAKGILHRDVKPENIFLLRRRGEDFVKVVDFGISKSLHTGESDDETPRLTQTGMVLGTPLYMSPEQARGEDDLDQRIDIYALGVILYEMVTGEVPFRGNNSLNIIARVLNDEVPPPRDLRPDLSPDLEAIIVHAMVKNRDLRYPTCDVLAADLAALDSAHRGDDGLHTTSRVRLIAPTPAHRRRSARLQPLIWLLGLAAVTVAVVGVVWLLMTGAETHPKAPPAESHTALPSGPETLTTSAPVAPNQAAPESVAEVVELGIRTEPPGAAIYEGSRLRGIAPLTFSAPGTDSSIELTAELEGYEPASFKVNPLTDSDEPIIVRLIKTPQSTTPPPTPEIRPTRSNPPNRARNPRTDSARQPAQTSPPTSGTAAGELGGNPYRRSDGDNN